MRTGLAPGAVSKQTRLLPRVTAYSFERQANPEAMKSASGFDSNSRGS
jgi:hypothetical protein